MVTIGKTNMVGQSLISIWGQLTPEQRKKAMIQIGMVQIGKRMSYDPNFFINKTWAELSPYGQKCLQDASTGHVVDLEELKRTS